MTTQPTAAPSQDQGPTDTPLLEETIGQNLARTVERFGERDALAGRTVLLATQRLSTLALAERVAVLDEGRVAEIGEPAELLERGEAFTALFGEETPVH